MTRIALVNMPFAALDVPSLALTQLEGVLRRRFGDQVTVEVHYLNHEFVEQVGGLEAYRGALTTDALTAGLGDWIFRPVAFPDAPDTEDAYFRRYFYRPDGSGDAIRASVLRAQEGLTERLDELVERHDLGGADMVGFTAFFAQNVANIAMARRVKHANPDVVTLMGGPTCELGMGDALAKNVDCLDFVFSGPALVSFPRFVETWLAGDEAGLHGIDGVLSKRNAPRLPGERLVLPDEDEAGEAVARPMVGPLGEELSIDEPVPLDYGPYLDMIEARYPQRQVEPTLFFETSRGCWWGERSHCTFCGLNSVTMAYRAMEPDRAVAQFEELFAYAGRCRRLDCVDNILPRNYVEEVFPRLQTPEGVRIHYEVRANLKDEELAAMAKAEVRVIQPGIESLTTPTLKLMGKGTTSFKNLAFLLSCLKHDILPAWNLLVGFPGEGEDSYQHLLENMPSLHHLPPPTGVFPVRFDRFSPYFSKADVYGLELEPFDSYRLIYPFEPEAVRELAYYFRDVRGDADYLVALNRWLDKLQAGVATWRRRWYGDARAEAPRLHLVPGTTRVHDSRVAAGGEHDLGPAGLAVLQALKDPAKPKALAAKVGEVPGLDLDAEVARLRGLGLVFQEGERLASVVLPEAAPSLRHIRFPEGTEEVRDVAEPAAPPAAPQLVRRDRRARRLRREE